MDEILAADRSNAVERSEPRAISVFEEELLIRSANRERTAQEAREADTERLYAELALERAEEDSDLPAYHSIYEDAVAIPEQPGAKPAASRFGQIPELIGNRVRKAIGYIRESAPTWFAAEKPDSSSNRKRFPISAFAAILTVAVCMMMIVAGSLMLTSAESEVYQLNVDIDRLQGEITDLRSEMESNENLLRIREIAVEEYGMVGEEYLKMDYMQTEQEERIEVFSGERDEKIGLAGLLSAIGLGK